MEWTTEDGTATAGEDYTAVSGTLTFGPGETTKTVSVIILNDSLVDNGETITLRLSNASGATIDDAEATGTITDDEAAVGGNTAPTGLPTISGTARVGETLPASSAGISDADGLANATYAWQWITNDGTSDADISGATGATYTLTASEAGKTIKVRVTFTDDGGTEETLVSATTTAVTVNNAPTGLPTISGTARVGETLTASSAGISDADGLTNATYAWQWITNGGTSDTDIAGATAATYMLTAAEEGKTVKVRVTFTDDAGTEETFVSDATAQVAAGLTASFSNLPTNHDGSAVFTFELRFSEEIQISYRTLRDTSLEVSGGTITRARRQTRGSNIDWTITVEPDTDGDVTIALPAGRACNAAGAVCTAAGTQLLSRVDATVPGPASGASEVSIATATNPGLERSQASNPVTEGASAVFTLTRTGDTATALTVNVTVSESGTMLSGTPPATATFEIGSATAALTVATEDDEVAEAASEITAALATGSGYSMESGAASATVTMQDDDVAPIVTTASPVLVSENGVAVATLTATDDDTPVADLAWSIAGRGGCCIVYAERRRRPGLCCGEGLRGAGRRGPGRRLRSHGARDRRGQPGGRGAHGPAHRCGRESRRFCRVRAWTAPALTLTFGEGLDEDSKPASDAFSVAVDGAARGVSDVSISGSTLTLTLASAVLAGETVTVSYTVPAGANANPLQDAADNAVAGFSGQTVTNDTPAHVNTPATGKPAISGTTRVGKTLTGSTSGIADADGLTNATFAWQWIANDGTSDTDIAGATAATYMLTAAEEGKTVKVRVTFTDDTGTEETFVSDATAQVAPGLTATFENIPEGHDGSLSFTLRVAFSEPISTRRMRRCVTMLSKLRAGR